MPMRAATAGLILALVAADAGAASGIVPDDFPSIQAALDQAVPADTILVRATQVWNEKLVFRRGGSAAGGLVTLAAFPGDRPILDGTGLPAGDMILIDSVGHVRVRGFEIRNNLAARDASGIRILGASQGVEILDNDIHDIRGSDAMGITVYGTDPVTSVSDLVIAGNVIHDCEPARSEALVLNGNVERFLVERNVVHDVNNIGIDFIGGETSICPDPSKVARDGICRANRVERARSIYGGGWAAGIYVDGGRDIVIENNVVTESDLGLEIGAENAGTDATGIVVRNNVIFRNDKVGIVFGGYDRTVGRVRGCTFENNTTWGNDTLGEGLGELWIQFAEGNAVRNNVFVSSSQGVLLYSEDGNVSNALDWNLWHAPAGNPEWVWRSVAATSLPEFQRLSGQEVAGLDEDPLLVQPSLGDVHLASGSPAIDRGDPSRVAAPGEADLDLGSRIAGGRVDMGADESEPVATCLPALLGVVSGVRVTKAGPDALVAWSPDPAAVEHHVNALTARAALPGEAHHRPPRGSALASCEAAAPAASCEDPGAIGDDRPLVFYQVVSACGPAGADEGPLR